MQIRCIITREFEVTEALLSHLTLFIEDLTANQLNLYKLGCETMFQNLV